MRLITRFYGMYKTSDLLNLHAAELSEVVGSQNTEMLSWKFAFSKSCIGVGTGGEGGAPEARAPPPPPPPPKFSVCSIYVLYYKIIYYILCPTNQKVFPTPLSCNVQNVFLSTVISHDDGPVCIIHSSCGSTAH